MMMQQERDSESRILFSLTMPADQSSGWAHVPLVCVNSATAAVTFRAIVGVSTLSLGERTEAIQLRYSERSRLLDVIVVSAD